MAGISYLPSIKSQIRGCSEITLEFWKLPLRSRWSNHLWNFTTSKYHLCQRPGEKKIWPSNLIGGTKEIVDLDSLGCPSLKNLRKSIHKDGGCSHHRSSLLTPKWNCASENVKLLKNGVKILCKLKIIKMKKNFQHLFYYNLYEVQQENNLKRIFVEIKNNSISFQSFPKFLFLLHFNTWH